GGGSGRGGPVSAGRPGHRGRAAGSPGDRPGRGLVGPLVAVDRARAARRNRPYPRRGVGGGGGHRDPRRGAGGRLRTHPLPPAAGGNPDRVPGRSAGAPGAGRSLRPDRPCRDRRGGGGRGGGGHRWGGGDHAHPAGGVGPAGTYRRPPAAGPGRRRPGWLPDRAGRRQSDRGTHRSGRAGEPLLAAAAGRDRPDGTMAGMTTEPHSAGSLRELTVGTGAGLETTDLALTIGPHHPSTHGTLRLKLTVDGERVVSCAPVVGYMHRGAEKLFEVRDYRQIMVLANRHDWLSAFASELGVALAVERMLGLEVPERAVWLRTTLAELNRVLNHLMFLGSYPREIGAITPMFYAFRERETLQAVMEEASGGRLHYMFNRVGGLKEEVPAGWTRRA